MSSGGGALWPRRAELPARPYGGTGDSPHKIARVGLTAATNGIMRLFVAIALPPEAASELDAVVAPLRPSWPELRWTGVDAWHLTLAFLAEVDEVVTGRLAVRLERAARRHAPLSLSLAGAGAFRFQDGSLLTYKLNAGTLCVHPPSANFTIIEQITGGTGRFANASGTLAINVPLAYPVLVDAASPPNPILIVIPSADVTGTIILPHREE